MILPADRSKKGTVMRFYVLVVCYLLSALKDDLFGQKIIRQKETAATTLMRMCSSKRCGVPGLYRVKVVLNQIEPFCLANGSGAVGFHLEWVDIDGTYQSIEVPLQTSGLTVKMMPFRVMSASNPFFVGIETINSNGAPIQGATTYFACTTGTGTYNLQVEVSPILTCQHKYNR